MTPAQWTILLAIALAVNVAAIVIVLILGCCRCAGEADDDADEYGERFIWSNK